MQHTGQPRCAVVDLGEGQPAVDRTRCSPDPGRPPDGFEHLGQVEFHRSHRICHRDSTRSAVSAGCRVASPEPARMSTSPARRQGVSGSTEHDHTGRQRHRGVDVGDHHRAGRADFPDEREEQDERQRGAHHRQQVAGDEHTAAGVFRGHCSAAGVAYTSAASPRHAAVIGSDGTSVRWRAAISGAIA